MEEERIGVALDSHAGIRVALREREMRSLGCFQSLVAQD